MKIIPCAELGDLGAFLASESEIECRVPGSARVRGGQMRFEPVLGGLGRSGQKKMRSPLATIVDTQLL
jgi:hypothetical protein